MITDFLSRHYGRNNFTAYPPVHHTGSKVCSQSDSPQVHNSAYLLIHSPHSQLDPPKVYKVQYFFTIKHMKHLDLGPRL